jgi:hypothetical protein
VVHRRLGDLRAPDRLGQDHRWIHRPWFVERVERRFVEWRIRRFLRGFVRWFFGRRFRRLRRFVRWWLGQRDDRTARRHPASCARAIADESVHPACARAIADDSAHPACA